MAWTRFAGLSQRQGMWLKCGSSREEVLGKSVLILKDSMESSFPMKCIYVFN